MAIRSFLAINKTFLALKPANRSAGNENGEVIDTRNFSEMSILQSAGVVAGAPTSLISSIDWQESDDQIAWSPVVGLEQNILTLADSVSPSDISLRDIFKSRYIRPDYGLSFVGGASPNLDVSALVVLSEARYAPV